MVDRGLGLHLLEINTNPALHLDNDMLAQLLPGVVEGTIGLVLGAHGRDLGPAAAAAVAAGDGGAAGGAGGGGGFQLILDENRDYEWTEQDEEQ